MTKYKTEKRKAIVGERILITNAGVTFGDYANGDTFTVKSIYHDIGVRTKELDERLSDSPHINHEEYEVIDESSERISALETEVAVLKAEVEALKQAKTTTVHNVSINADSFSITKEIERLANAYPPTKSANERRADVIKRAKAFVNKTQPLGGRRVEYVINADKRTVVALVYKVSFGFKNGIHAKGIAKCDPDDVFNADIGKAIALARALGVEVPEEFVKAVQPTEVVVGHILTFPTDDSDGWYRKVCYRVDSVTQRNDNLTIVRNEMGSTRIGEKANLDFSEGSRLPIIDDTDAVYE